jgi:TonB family protein
MKLIAKTLFSYLIILLSACSGGTEKLTIKDPIGVKESLSNVFKDGSGLYVKSTAAITSTRDLARFDLVLAGEINQVSEVKLITAGMNKTGRFLFHKINYLQIGNNISFPDKTLPAVTATEYMTIEGKSISAYREIYCKDADITSILSAHLGKPDQQYVYFLNKKDAGDVGENLKMLVFETVPDDGVASDMTDQPAKDPDEELPPPPPPSSGSPEEVKPQYEALQFAEVMPEFPGGADALMKFFSDNIVYPEAVRQQAIEGTVYARFVVLENGKTDQVTILRGIDPLLDNEAIRVIKKLPDFIPGKQGGKPVNVYFTIPVKFKLN